MKENVTIRGTLEFDPAEEILWLKRRRDGLTWFVAYDGYWAALKRLADTSVGVAVLGLEMVRRCDVLVVMRNFQRSVGTGGEFALALQLGRSTYLLDDFSVEQIISKIRALP